MSGDGRLLLLDTSIILQVVRGKATGQALDAAYGLRKRQDRPLVSVITIGEALAFAGRLSWGDSKLSQLRALFGELVVVDIRSESVLQRYAEIDAYLVGIGRRIGNNDTWIAATAAATGATLLTTDRDFDPLDGHWITRIWFNPAVAR